jgi:3-isopropylmalate dehydratase small subunit
MLVVELSEAEVDVIFRHVEANAGLQATVDLAQQQVELQSGDKTVFNFSIEPGDKEQLISGLDDIDLTLQFESDITRFEKDHDPLLFEY